MSTAIVSSVEKLLTHRRALLLLIFSFTAADFLQTGVVALNALPVMGDLAAGPEEYSLAATIYALVAIAAIYKQRWVVERLGWRLFARLSMGLFGMGAITCATSHALNGFLVGRVLMALGGSTFFTVGRVIVNHIPPSPARFTGIKYFANGLACGGILGPLVAVAALVHGSWRYAFLALLLPAALIVILSTNVLPNSSLPLEKRSQSNPTTLILLMIGSFALLHALQRSAYDWFAEPSWILAYAIGSAVLLVLFVARELRHERPTLKLGSLKQRRFLVGATAFTVTYVVVAANNYVFPLLARQALNMPLEAVGVLLAIGASAGLVVWQVMAGIVAKHPGPSRYFVAGFLCLGLSGFQLSRLSETANPWIHIAPALMMNGAFVMLVLATTAMQTFQKVQKDETIFSHANQVKNMLAQFGTAVGISLATLTMQWRSTVRYAQLVESITMGRTGVDQAIGQLTAHFAAVSDPALASQRALVQLAQIAANQATFMAVTDYFFGLCLAAVILLTVTLVERATRPRAPSSPRIVGAPVMVKIDTPNAA